MVVVTLGTQGVVWAGADGLHRRPAQAVKAVDTTGAGDTFIGAFAVAWLEGRGVPDAVDIAQRAAAHSVQRLGAQASIPRRAEVLNDLQPAKPL